MACTGRDPANLPVAKEAEANVPDWAIDGKKPPQADPANVTTGLD